MRKLEADGVFLSFSGRQILSDVYIAAQTGQVTGLLGRNGCGKSCLMKIIMNTMPCYSKSVRIDGRAWITYPDRNKLITYLPQRHFIPGYTRVIQALKFFGITQESFCRDIPELEERLPFRLNQLSGGEQRLVEAYLIIMSNAPFTLLDEPFTHVMPIKAERLKELIKREKQRKGFIVTDHLYRHISDLSDNLYLLLEGKTYLVRDHMHLQELGYIRISPTTAR